jgi:hypothetical protein
MTAFTTSAICWRKSLAPPEAGCRTRCMSAFRSFSCKAATLPSATISSHGNRSRNTLTSGKPAERSDFVGVRLLKIPRRGSNECHGNAFERTNCSGDNPNFSNVLQTIVAVGSEKPSGHFSGLLVRRGAMLEKTCAGYGLKTSPDGDSFNNRINFSTDCVDINFRKVRIPSFISSLENGSVRRNPTRRRTLFMRPLRINCREPDVGVARCCCA